MDRSSFSPSDRSSLASCPTCHQVQRMPTEVGASQVPVCCRCGASLTVHQGPERLAWTRHAALAALICYPLAISLPALRIEQWGHVAETSIVGGIGSLFAEGHLGLALIVLLCSVVLPLCKLAGLWIVCSPSFLKARHRAITYQWIEWSGRWGMVDVLLVAALVASLKIGDLVNVYPGTGALLFAAVVIFNLLASAFFHPLLLWGRRQLPPPNPASPVDSAGPAIGEGSPRPQHKRFF